MTTRRVLLFLGLAYGLAWALWVPMAVAGVTVEPGRGWPSHLPGLLAPAVAALVVTAATEGRRGLKALGARAWRWPLAGPMARTVGLVVLLTACCVFVPLLESPSPSPEAFLTYSGAPRIGPAVILYVAILNGLGEELGWRGYLVDALLPRLGGVRAAVVTWVAWAAWHAPLFLAVDTFRGFGVVGILGWTIGLGCASLVLTWLYVASGRSVLVTAVWHTAYNFATATAAASSLSSALATAIVIGLCVGLVRHPGFWGVRGPTARP